MHVLLTVAPAVGFFLLLLLALAVVLAVRVSRRSPTLVQGAREPRKGTPAEVWLRRGERTARTLHDQVEQARGQAVAAQLSDVDSTSAAVLADLRRVSAQATAVEDALFRIDAPRLRAHEVDPTGSAAEQLAIADRLDALRTGLIDRMESTVVGMDGLTARLAEVLALSATAGGIDQAGTRIGELSDQLEGLRYGLAETEQLSQGVLRALPPGPDGPPTMLPTDVPPV